MKYRKFPRVAVAALLSAVALAAAAQSPATGPGKFIPTFLVYYGGAPSLGAADVPALAKFDLIDIDRFRYADVSPNTWAAVRAANPNIGIYLYEMGPEAPNYMDSLATVSLNGLGRYDVSRGHSMGSLNGSHPELFLLDGSGNRIYNKAYSKVGSNQYWHLMDFGSSAYQAYWVEAVRADIANQPWVADGVHADNCLTLAAAGGYSATPSKYPTDAAWSGAMNAFASAISAGLRGFGQKLWCNRGETRSAVGSSAWLSLDASTTPPDVVADEGAFAVAWGPSSTQFYPEADWKRQLDTMAAIRNSKVAIFSHTALAEGQSGTDNWGRPVSYWQTLWYALGSFLLGKNGTQNNAYFNFSGNGGAYNRIWWYPEYELIDLGSPAGPYRVTAIGGVNVYWREFERGYVYVNPTATDVAAVALPQSVKQLTHGNLGAPTGGLPDVNSIALAGHNAVILLKSTLAPLPDTVSPSTPTGLGGTAVSSAQISLSWSASTDNVGVAGYKVFRGGVQIATTTAASYADTGLSPSTKYRYTVSAFDAAANNSAKSGDVTIRTQARPDTTAPGVPAGLAAAAASSAQINLSWSASTDNVGVAGYKVFRAGAQIATTTATSYSDSGLAPSTGYSYTVAAFDATGNTSAQSTPASAITLAAARVRSDFNGDGKADLLWRNSATGEDRLWFMNGAEVAADSALAAVPDLSWSIAGTGDFNADGKADVLWRNLSTGEISLWQMNGAAIASGATVATVADLNWGIAAVADFDGDGKADVLWRHSATGSNIVWFMNGSAILAGPSTTPLADLNWGVAGTGDFNGDGKADILWRNRASGETALWLMNGSAVTLNSAFATVADLGWGIAGVGDFDGNGKADILWRHAMTGDNIVWLMNGAGIASAAPVTAVADRNWSIAGVADFDGDGKADILWRNGATGEDGIYFMNGGTVSAVVFTGTMPVAGWSVALR